jgi:hypothetical protein
MNDAIFFPLLLYDSICGFLVCVIIRIVVFIFYFLLDLWVLNLCL